MALDDTADSLRHEIELLVEKYYRVAFPERPFLGGINHVAVAGKVFDQDEMKNVVHSALDFWLTSGRFVEEFEKSFATVMGARYALLCNSGSSANLLALSALKSPELKDRALKDGDEVLTVAAGFPTTVNPIIQNQLVPVFTDVQLGTYDARVESLERAIGPRTKAIMMAHTLGNPFNLDGVMELAKEHNLFVIEDSADAVGAMYRNKPVGSFGDLATASFYPAHHITMGEGGAVLVNGPRLKKIVESFRDWGRDCWCLPGHDNTCGKRFDWQLGELPHGYDHKYIYSHIGYNLKATEMQAAIGVAQLKKLPAFIDARKRNFEFLFSKLKSLEEYFILPEATPKSDPSWFGFAITVRETAPFSRPELIAHLDEHRIGTRLLFGGNLIKQPAYKGLQYRIAEPLTNADLITTNTFWIGVYPGLTTAALEYVTDTISQFVSERTR